MKETKNIIEGLLFVSEGPLTVEQVKTVLEDTPSFEIRRAISALSSEYEARKGPIVVHEVAGGFQLRTRPEYKEYIHRLKAPTPVRLSKAAMETLAIVAYRQPVLRTEVEHIRGVNSGNTLRFLQEKKLVRVLGRRDVPGRPLVYGTTKKFLETFDLKDLKDLPKPDEIEDAPPPSPKPQPGYRTPDLPMGSTDPTDPSNFKNNA
ncbi:MAG: SMC-Scp complex subunit ScpB [Desulfosalsimonadaceae bacterium]